MNSQTTQLPANIQERQRREATITRLRAEAAEVAKSEYADGHKVGKEWASQGENGVSFVDLKRLNGWVERSGSIWADRINAAQIAAVIDEGTDCEDFWDSVCGTYSVTEDDRASEFFLKGFVEGALEIFAQV